MGLWYNCGNGFVKTNWARKESGMDAYLVCPGPSLSKVNFDIRGRGRKVFGVNTSYPKVIPDIWVGMDKAECYNRNLLFEPFAKIFRGTYHNMEIDGYKLHQLPEMYFADVGKVDNLFRERAHDIKFAWHKHTLGVVLHIMVWMGFKIIHFVGNDLGGAKDYYDDRVLSDKNRKYNRRLYKEQVGFLKRFKEQGVRSGVRCVSCTPDSPINEFMQYIHIEDAVKLTENRHSYLGEFDIKHAVDVG